MFVIIDTLKFLYALLVFIGVFLTQGSGILVKGLR
jgi:hypothetical protein